MKELVEFIEKGKAEEKNIKNAPQTIKRLKKVKSETEKFEFCLDEHPIGQIVESYITLVKV